MTTAPGNVRLCDYHNEYVQKMCIPSNLYEHVYMYVYTATCMITWQTSWCHAVFFDVMI